MSTKTLWWINKTSNRPDPGFAPLLDRIRPCSPVSFEEVADAEAAAFARVAPFQCVLAFRREMLRALGDGDCLAEYVPSSAYEHELIIAAATGVAAIHGLTLTDGDREIARAATARVDIEELRFDDELDPVATVEAPLDEALRGAQAILHREFDFSGGLQEFDGIWRRRILDDIDQRLGVYLIRGSLELWTRRSFRLTVTLTEPALAPSEPLSAGTDA